MRTESLLRRVAPMDHRGLSNSRADRAGERFRTWALLPPDERDAATRGILSEVSVIAEYRALHEYPLRKVAIGVRTMLRTELGRDAPRPAQRFKRMDRILSKLLRYPTTRLSQIEDIGGCRAVFESLEDVYASHDRIVRRWPHARVTDHIAEPKLDGYRSLHIIEKRDGRLIEVQLRTARQHRWAEMIEIWGARTGFALKDDEGPADLLEYFSVAAARLAREDRGESADDRLEHRMAILRERVRPHFAERD